MYVGGLALVFVVFFVWEPTKVGGSDDAEPEGDDRSPPESHRPTGAEE